jgi:hypothetical protein
LCPAIADTNAGQVLGTGERMEGNCLCRLNKNVRRGENGFVLERGKKNAVRRNLFQLARDHADSILEVGFNAGHSCALFCYGWDMRDVESRQSAPSTGRGSGYKYLGFDLCEHDYARPCFEELRRIYVGNEMAMVVGDSREMLGAYAHDEAAPIYDLIHIDGGHKADEVRKDTLLCRRFAKPGETILLIDDTKWPAIADAIAQFIEDSVLAEVDYDRLGLTKTATHQMFVYNS